MKRPSERVKTFFDQYELNIAASDPAVIAAQYGESFVFAGPQGTMYLLQQNPDGLRIVFQRDYDDLTKRVQELGLVSRGETSA